MLSVECYLEHHSKHLFLYIAFKNVVLFEIQVIIVLDIWALETPNYLMHDLFKLYGQINVR